MSWIRFEKLNKHNCVVASVRFVNRISRRAREANLNDPHYIPIIEALIHVEDHPRRGDRRWGWNDNVTKGWRNWSKKSEFPSCKEPYRTYTCGRTHLWLYVDHNHKLYSTSKKKTREVDNPWLLNTVLKKVSV